MDQVKNIRKLTNRARAAYAMAKQGKYALGAFNVDNQETLLAIVLALKNKNAPALVEVSDSEVKAIGLANLRDMVDNYKKEYGVELYVNLDHAPTVESCQKAIDAGFEFIHIDISQANHNAAETEIVKATKEVVDYAKRTGALVESEPHYFAGSSNLHKEAIDYQAIKKQFTKPEEALDFVKATGIDTFAVAIGNLHGKYPVPKKLDIDLLKAIHAKLPCFLSLHGGSGTPVEYFRQAVLSGITKININSDMRVAYREGLEAELEENPDEYAIVKLMPEVIEDVQKVVEEKLEMFGAVNKAVT